MFDALVQFIIFTGGGVVIGIILAWIFCHTVVKMRVHMMHTPKNDTPPSEKINNFGNFPIIEKVNKEYYLLVKHTEPSGDVITVYAPIGERDASRLMRQDSWVSL